MTPEEIKKENVKESQRKWRAANKEKFNKLMRKWRAANKEKTMGYNRKWYAENQEKVICRYREEMTGITPLYVAALLRMPVSEIPMEIMELKRNQIKVHRVLKNIKQKTKNK